MISGSSNTSSNAGTDSNLIVLASLAAVAMIMVAAALFIKGRRVKSWCPRMQKWEPTAHSEGHCTGKGEPGKSKVAAEMPEPAEPLSFAAVLPPPGYICEEFTEFEFAGKPGTGNVVVVSCPGGEDPAIRMGPGEIYSTIKNMQDLAVSVVFLKEAHISTFWDAWREGLANFAVGKDYVVTITKNDGTIGNVQSEEVKYLELCNGERDSPFGSKRTVDLSKAHKLVMTFKEFFFWRRLDFRKEMLGTVLPLPAFQNDFVKRLPSLPEMEARFKKLTSLPTTDHCKGHLRPPPPSTSSHETGTLQSPASALGPVGCMDEKEAELEELERSLRCLALVEGEEDLARLEKEEGLVRVDGEEDQPFACFCMSC